jgi:hypothetical protein
MERTRGSGERELDLAEVDAALVAEYGLSDARGRSYPCDGCPSHALLVVP